MSEQLDLAIEAVLVNSLTNKLNSFQRQSSSQYLSTDFQLAFILVSSMPRKLKI
jgi:hypothetical protein